jgi:hypothetical protein
MWLLRTQGKPNYTPPVSMILPILALPSVSLTHSSRQEQFTAEWDWVADNPSEEAFVSEEDIERGILPPPPIEIAGKYCWKTNLYQLALVSYPPSHRYHQPGRVRDNPPEPLTYPTQLRSAWSAP